MLQKSKLRTQLNLGFTANAALVEETASASQSMGEQARELQELMSFFKLGEQQTQADY
jgi:methyl-accepting chemotaxis protein